MFVHKPGFLDRKQIDNSSWIGASHKYKFWKITYYLDSDT